MGVKSSLINTTLYSGGRFNFGSASLIAKSSSKPTLIFSVIILNPNLV